MKKVARSGKGVYTIVMNRKRDYRVVCDAAKQKDMWLRERHNLITGTAISALLGVNKYVNYMEIMEEKSTPYEPGGGFTGNRHTAHGSKNELINMEKTAESIGLFFRHSNLFLVSKEDRIGITLDGLCSLRRDAEADYKYTETKKEHRAYTGPWVEEVRDQVQSAGGVGILEMKQTGFISNEWKARVPDAYYCQVQAQLMITGLPWAIVGCQIGADNMIAHFVNHDWDMQDEIREVVRDFWGRVGK